MQSVVSIPGFPVYVWDPVRGMVMYMVPVGTPFVEVATWVPVQAPVVVEQQQAPVQTVAEQPAPAEEEGLTEEQEEADAFFKLTDKARAIIADFGDENPFDPLDDAEKSAIKALKEGLSEGKVEKIKQALEDWEAVQEQKDYLEEEDEQVAHVVQLLEEDKVVEAKKENARELFVLANKKFHAQKALYDQKASRADLQVAQLDYIKTVDELRAVVAKISDPAFTLRAMADERWPHEKEKHVGFEKNMELIYNRIKYKTENYVPDEEVVRKPAAAEKRAPATLQLSLEDLLAPHMRGGGRA